MRKESVRGKQNKTKPNQKQHFFKLNERKKKYKRVKKRGEKIRRKITQKHVKGNASRLRLPPKNTLKKLQLQNMTYDLYGAPLKRVCIFS